MLRALRLLAIPSAFAVAALALHAAAPSAGVLQPMFHEPDEQAFAILACAVVTAAAAYLGLAASPRASHRSAIALTVATLATALAVPVVLSGDARAYAAYGALALRGEIWPHVLVAPATGGVQQPPAVAAALADWGGRLPANVYGPLFTALAAAIVAVAHGGPDAARLLLRLAACAAWTGVVALAGRRTILVVAAHPVALWTVAEGHNDAFFLLALALGAHARSPRVRTAAATVAAAIKAIAVAPLVASLVRRRDPQRVRDAVLAAAVLGIAYAPLLPAAFAHASAGPYVERWSPFALIVHVHPLWPLAVALLVASAAVAARAFERDRLGSAAFFAWVAAPVIYPWYATWLLPLVVRAPQTPVNRALLAASLCAFAAYGQDAVTLTGSTALSVGIMLVQYAVPITVLAVALAQVPPTPGPRAETTPLPSPPAGATAAPATPGASTTPGPTPLPATATPVPTAAPTATPAPAPTATPVAFNYVVVPTPEAKPNLPRINEIAVIDRVVHVGGALLARVRTSPDVSAVVAHVMGQSLALAAAGPGVFTLDARIPGGVPFWFLRDYDIDVVAQRPDGSATNAHLKVRLAR